MIRTSLAGLVLFAAHAAAAPVTLPHSGRLTDSTGKPLSSTADLVVRVVADQAGSDERFSQTFPATPFHDGLYQVVLGSNGTTLNSAVFATDEPLWLEATAAGNTTVRPLLWSAMAPTTVDVLGGEVVASSVTVTGSGEVVLGQSTADTCTEEGQLIYDPTAQAVEVCTGGTYTAVSFPRTLTVTNGPEGRTWSNGSVAASCEAYRFPADSSHLYAGDIGDGSYRIDPDGNGALPAWTAQCDMTTDGGGWTIVHAATGADGQIPLVSNTEVSGDPLTFQAYNVSRAQKMALAAVSTESLFLRSSGPWLRADAVLFDANLDTPGQHPHQSVQLTARNGVTATATMGYSNVDITGGGDFGLRTGTFDHHSALYNHLERNCEGHYLYSYSRDVLDSDAGYDVLTALGDWPATGTCTPNEGGALQFRTAVR